MMKMEEAKENKKDPIFTWDDKKPRSSLWCKVDSVLLTVLLIACIWAYVHGHFIANEVHIMEVCEGVPSTLNGDILPSNYTIALPTKLVPEAEKVIRREYIVAVD